MNCFKVVEAENKTLKNQLAEARRREQEERERSQEVGPSVNMNMHFQFHLVRIGSLRTLKSSPATL